MTTTLLSQSDLRRIAVSAVRDEAKAAKCRARCLSYSLEIGGPYGPVLLAHGVRSDDQLRQGTKAYRFDVRVVV